MKKSSFFTLAALAFSTSHYAFGAGLSQVPNIGNEEFHMAVENFVALPDSGMTLVLLGAALAGTEMLRRVFAKRSAAKVKLKRRPAVPKLSTRF